MAEPRGRAPLDPRTLEAVVFDFHGTLAAGGSFTYEVALATLLDTLRRHGQEVARDDFEPAYRRQVIAYFEQRVLTGNEQHNTLWVARALTEIGRAAQPDDEAVQAAVTAYFERYAREMALLSGARELLAALDGRVRLALLSNFTDPRPVRGVLRREGLDGYFEEIVISGEIGRCKPHRDVFDLVVGRLAVAPERTLYVGDDPRDDVGGASGAGLRTAWIRTLEPQPLRRWIDGWVPAEPADPDWTVAGLPELQARLV